jgi:ATP synthase protein I
MTVRQKTNVSPSSPYWIPLLQIGVSLLLSAVGLVFGIQYAVSVLLGALICVVGNAVFIWRFFRRGNSQSARDLLSDAYQGALSKMLLTTLLFVIVLVVFKELEILLLFVGFIAAQIVNWIAPLLMKRKIYR